MSISNEILANKIDNLTNWIKRLNKKVDIQNGRIVKSETEIALIKQRIKLRSEIKNQLETWSRKKIIFFGGAVITFVQLFILILIEIIKRII